MRIAVVYDCLYPNTVGGAERWLRALAERLGERHEVTYVTRRQWPRGKAPEVAGVRCVAVSPGGDLYTPDGRRRLLPPVLFGLGVLLHFLRNRRDYDVVHCLSYPFLSLIAVRLALIGNRSTRVYCEWLEYLSPQYWRDYAGRVGGTVGRLVQGLCLRLTPAAFVFSRLVESRLRAGGYTRELHRLTGLWMDSERNGEPAPGKEPLLVFVGRHVPDKRVLVLPDAIMLARRAVPGIRAVIAGEGPERQRLLARIGELGLDGTIDAPGYLPPEDLERLFTEATCFVMPSIRDGHGMAIVEAMAAGLPAVVCRSADNAATELVEDGVNGVIAPDASPAAVADGILRVMAQSEVLQQTVVEWFDTNADRLSVGSSLAAVGAVYADGAAAKDAERALV